MQESDTDFGRNDANFNEAFLELSQALLTEVRIVQYRAVEKLPHVRLFHRTPHAQPIAC